MRLPNNNKRRLWILVMQVGLLILLWSPYAAGIVKLGESATLLTPTRIGGANGKNDQRDADIYPAVAYDSVSKRYLVVWLSGRNANSSSDGLDVYGRFLNDSGQPIGAEFRISDSNTAARNGFPAIVAGNGEFVVVWTAKAGWCRIQAQRITDTSAQADKTLVTSSSLHLHSPALTYHPTRQRYALAYVSGDDYLPPTLFGASTSDCANNAASVSQLKATEFYFSGNTPSVGTPLNLSDTAGGAFRPGLAFSSSQNGYLAVWEDRRSAAGQQYRFDVYAQRLSSTLTKSGANTVLHTGGNYSDNQNGSTTWTPRPAVTGGNRFLATWFTYQNQGAGKIWSVYGQRISLNGSVLTKSLIAEATFAETHTTPPTGFLVGSYNGSSQEHIVALSSHLESIWGYLSSVRIQRVDSNGNLVDNSGSISYQAGVGNSIDYANDDQIGVNLAINPLSNYGKSTDYLVVYSKHAPGKPSQDFDIWNTIIRLPVSSATSKQVYIPIVTKRR